MEIVIDKSFCKGIEAKGRNGYFHVGQIKVYTSPLVHGQDKVIYVVDCLSRVGKTPLRIEFANKEQVVIFVESLLKLVK